MPITTACALCAKVKLLPHRRGEQRVCKTCYLTKVRVEMCARCHRMGRVGKRLGNKSVCLSCWVRDPALKKPCTRCGAVSNVAATVNGKSFCQLCYKRPMESCSSCGEERPVQSRKSGTPVCKRCYGALRRGKIPGQLRPRLPVAERRLRVCSGCDNERYCAEFLTSSPLCAGCQGPPQTQCVGCGQLQLVHTHWPGGPVCRRCYDDYPATERDCVACNQRLLTAPTEQGPRCRSCLEAPRDYCCSKCDREVRLYAGGACAGCHLSTVVLPAFMANQQGETDERLVAVAELLRCHPTPRAIMRWLQKSKSAKLLRSMALGYTEISHTALDGHESQWSATFLRSLLTAAGTIPYKDPADQRISLWLGKYLARAPKEDAALIAQFAQWGILRRLRRKAHGVMTDGSIKWAQGRIRTATRFLAWLRQRGVLLSGSSQADVDRWLASSDATTAYCVRDFVRWARARRLMGEVRVPLRQVQHGGRTMDETERWQLIESLLDDQNLDLDLRIIALLLLVFGQHVSRTVYLAQEDVLVKGDSISLMLGAEPVELPPALGKLLVRQAEAEARNPKAMRMDGSRWLFPGQGHGTHLSSSVVEKRLSKLDVFARLGRNAALMELSARLEPGIVARMLNMSVGTAVTWARIAGRTYNSHIGRRKDGLRRSTPIPRERRWKLAGRSTKRR